MLKEALVTYTMPPLSGETREQDQRDKRMFYLRILSRGVEKIHNEELHDLYSSSNILRVIKSRSISWAEHVAWMEEGRGVYRV
jgi:hypothetical protein